MSLTKLQLDNNIIEEIKGLDSLVNLIWLGRLLLYAQLKLFLVWK